MTMLWLVALPLVMALVVLLLRDLPLLAAPLSAGTLIAMAILSLSQPQSGPLIVLGRPMNLLPQEAASLAFCAMLLAVLMIYSFRISQGPLAYALTLLAMSFFALATMVRNTAIAGLMLEMGAIVAIMLVPSRKPGAAMAGMRILVLLALSGPLLLLAAWAMEGRAINPDNAFLARIGGVALAVGFGIGLAVVPFHVWLPPIFRYGNALAAVMLSVVLGIVILLRLGVLLQVSMWPGEREFLSTLLLGGGGITALVAGIMAVPQRSVSRALAYAALADLGIALVGLGISTPMSTSAAMLHLTYRGIGILVVSMSLGILRQSLDGDDLEHLSGAWRRTPLAVLGLAIGGLSLAGLPFTAGFSSRVLLYRSLATDHIRWTIAIIACSLGPAWAFMRCIAAALVSAPTAGMRHEPLLPGVLVVVLSVLLVILGISPWLLSLLPSQWAWPLSSGIFMLGQ